MATFDDALKLSSFLLTQMLHPPPSTATLHLRDSQQNSTATNYSVFLLSASELPERYFQPCSNRSDSRLDTKPQAHQPVTGPSGGPSQSSVSEPHGSSVLYEPYSFSCPSPLLKSVQED